MSVPAQRSIHIPTVILGAGLTGLSAALALQRRKHDFRVFERAARVGGYATTREESGWRFDCTGHLLHFKDPNLRGRVEAWLGDELVEVQRRSMVWSHGGYTRYPFQANTHGLPPRVAFECVMGFLQAQGLVKAPPRNFEDYCRAHFGEGMTRYFMEPYNRRLWGVPPREISTDWCQRFVPTPSLEDVIAGAVGLADRELGYNTSFLYPRRGIGALPEAMRARLSPTDLQLERAPICLDAEARRLVFSDAAVTYDTLISSIPLPSLLKLLTRRPPAMEKAAGVLRHTGLFYLDLAFDGPCQRDVHWVYVPEDRYPFYRVGCYSNFSKEMAPAGKSGFYVELVDREPPDMATVVPRVVEQMVEMGLVANSSQLVFARSRRLDPAYVIYDHSHSRATEVCLDHLRALSVLSTGRYGGWNYSSMEDALRFGEEAAEWAAWTNQ